MLYLSKYKTIHSFTYSYKQMQQSSVLTQEILIFFWGGDTFKGKSRLAAVKNKMSYLNFLVSGRDTVNLPPFLCGRPG